jgi:membrane-bound lytic murein transglycosylase D
MERAEVYVPLLQQILREEGLPEELVYLSMIESGFNPKAYSYAHAVGPWQFIRSTGRIFGLKSDWWYDERRDPVKATYAACKYLKRLYTEFDDWYLALAAYNSGEGRVHRHMRHYNTRDYWELKRLPRQTRNYVPTFLAALTIMKDPEKYGFKKISFKGYSEYDSVLVTECLDLNLVADIIETDYQSLKDLNPAIVRWCTPPTQDSIWLKVPLGTTAMFHEKVATIPEDQKRSWVRHKVRSGETLSIIAQKYRTSMKAIMDIKSNNIRSPHRISAGKYLLIPVPPNKYSSGLALASIDYDEEYIPDGRSRVTYTVRKGDNLGLIAQKFGTSVKSLKGWNNLWGK